MIIGPYKQSAGNFVALGGDVSKMHHSVYISEKDQHTHRYMWRDLSISSPIGTYIMRVVSFGDRPAGTIVSGTAKHS